MTISGTQDRVDGPSVPRVLTLPVGVVVAREAISHPWKDHIWRVEGILLNPPPLPEWHELRRSPQGIHYFAAILPLELHPTETMAYQVNLANGEPSVYVVLREDPQASGAWPVSVHLVTASPFEVQAYGETGEETIGRVPMPGPLVELVEAYVAEHHTEEVFQKRRRRPHVEEEEHIFGQEPLIVLRERMKSRRQDGGDA